MIALNVITFIHLSVFFLLLFFRKDNSSPNKLLGLILIVPGLNFINNVFVLLDIAKHFPYLLFFVQATAFTFAPLVFYYVYLMTGIKVKMTHPLFLITALFILITFGFAVEFSLMTDKDQTIYLNGLMQEPYPYQMEIVNSLFILMQLVYFTFAAIRVFKYKRQLQNTYSNSTKTKIKFTVQFITLIWILNFLSIISYIIFESTTVEYIVLPLVLIFIYSFIFYFAFKHHTVFSKADFEKFEDYQKILKEKPIYINSTENVDNAHFVLKKIERAIEDEKVHHEIGFTINDFATAVEEPSYKISQAINTYYKQNFNAFINTHRIKDAQSILKLGTSATMESLAFSVGFNSRASFYRAFQNETSLSPKEFIEQFSSN